MKIYVSFQLTFILFLSLITVCMVQAHEVRPGYLQLKQIDALTYNVLWKIPAKGERRLSLYVRLPGDCRSEEKTSSFVGGAYIERWQVTCEDELKDETIAIDGLEATRTDVLVRVEYMNNQTKTARLTASQPEFKLSGTPGLVAVVQTYFKLGVEHILLGFDHLLFVMALLFLVEGRRRLVGTITAFTIAHSLTLAGATFGWVQVPQAPVEAIIALSIMFVSVEILHRYKGRGGIAASKPWVVAFIFGLLHGFGFAGALQEIGLPNDAIPLALAFFNVGVEVGQLIFVATVLLLFSLINKLTRRHSATAERSANTVTAFTQPAAYAIGTLASFWLIQRTYGFFI